METHLEPDAQLKAPPPGIIDDHIGNRVACLEGQFKVVHAFIHPGDIVSARDADADIENNKR